MVAQAHHPFAIADVLLQKAQAENKSLTPMQLIKLVYIANGWTLGLLDRPLVFGSIEAWQYGPVLPALYHEFKQYGSRSVPVNATEAFREQLDDEELQIVDRVWRSYSHLSALQLSTLTHQAGTPWDKIWNEQKGSLRRGALIPPYLIRDHYRAKADAARQR